MVLDSAVTKAVLIDEPSPESATDVTADPTDEDIDGTADIDDIDHLGPHPDDAQQLIDGDGERDEAAVSAESAGETSPGPSIRLDEGGFPDTLSVESWPDGLDPAATTATVELLARSAPRGRLPHDRCSYTRAFVGGCVDHR